MKLEELSDEIVDEVKASAKLCKSSTPNEKLGASQLASCKSQGYRAREANKSAKVGSKRIRYAGKKIKGIKYGGPTWQMRGGTIRNRSKKK